MKDTLLSTELRFIRLERRLDRIEQQLGLAAAGIAHDTPQLEPPPVEATPEFAPPQPVPDEHGFVPGVPDERGYVEPTPVAPTPENISVPPPLIALKDEPAAFSSPIPRPTPTIQYRPQKPMPKSSRQPQALEQTIGLKWAGWVGAIVLVIGAALGVKYAYDQHWFGHLSPTLKLSFIIATGFALIGAGEFIYRKIHIVPAASVFGAGVATLFIAAYVGQAYFKLYDARTSQIAMTIATLIGAAVAMRGNLVSIGVLSLIGGNIAPLVVGDRNAPITPFLGYLLMLQLVAITLAACGQRKNTGGKWWTLRGLSLATTSIWISQLIDSHKPIVLSAMLVYAAIYHLELIITTIRRAPINRAHAPGVTFSFFITAALTFGVLWFHLDAPPKFRGEWILGIAGACAALGFSLPAIRPTLKPLALAHKVAAVALLVLWVPIALGGQSVLVGWLILSAALALSWVFTGSIVSRYAAPATWMLALIRLVFLTMNGHAVAWFTVMRTEIPSHAVLAWIASLVGFVVARSILVRTKPDDGSRWLNDARVLSVLASAVWAGAAVMHLPYTGATLMILALAWILMLPGEMLAPQLAPTLQSAALIIGAAIKWAVLDALITRLSPEWSASKYQPVLNPLMAVGALIAASLAALYFVRGEALLKSLRGQREIDTPTRAFSLFWLIVLIVGIFTIGFSFEIDRIVEIARPHLHWRPWQMKQMSWTMLWCANFVGIALAGARILDESRRRSLLTAVWLISILLALKYAIVDTLMGLFENAPHIAPLFNIQMMTGLVVLISIMLMRWLSARDATTLNLRQLRGQLAMLALLVIAWMGTMEIDRAVTWFGVVPAASWHFKNLGFSMWWMICAAGAFAMRRRLDPDAPPTDSWLRILPICVTIVAVKYLTIDTIAWRIMHRPLGLNVLVNFEAAAAAVVLAGLALIWIMGLPSSIAQARRTSLANRMATLAVLVLLWAGTIEIDRAFWLPAIRGTLTDPNLAEQVALSIFWSIFAVASVVLGFILRTSRMRYFGLALLALTLAKVALVDLRGVDTGYRILSFLGLGLLLLGTSVMYGKLSPKLLRPTVEEAAST